MPRLTIIHCLFFFILLTSCDKGNENAAQPAIPGIWGKLSSVKQTSRQISGPDTAVTYTEFATAAFYADPANSNSLTEAGSVTINNINLIRNTSTQIYEQEDAGLGFDDSLKWRVTGNSIIPQFSFKDTETFPEYTGEVPYVITKANGLELIFDNTTVIGADSVRVWIDDAQGHTTLQTFLATAGQVTIPAPALSPLSNVGDQTAVIAIMPYTGVNKVFLNKGFYFTRERRVYQSININ